MKYVNLIWLLVFLLAAADPTTAAAGDVYLPMVMRGEVPRSIRITSADCIYVIVDFVNPPEAPDISYYAGTLYVQKLGDVTRYKDLHYWYHDPGQLMWRYWGSYDFEPGKLYRLNAFIKGAESGGLYWVENGGQLWLPCQPGEDGL